MCKTFGCLPSQLENEDVALMSRIQQAIAIDLAFRTLDEDSSQLSPSQWIIIRDITAERKTRGIEPVYEETNVS